MPVRRPQHDDMYRAKQLSPATECCFRRASGHAEEMFDSAFEKLVIQVPAERRDEAVSLFASRRIEVVRQMLLAFEALRRERGDQVGIPFEDWEQRAQIIMHQAIIDLIRELGLDDGEDVSGTVADPDGPPPAPSGSARLPVCVMRLPLLTHAEYLGDRDAVAKYALDRARDILRRRHGTFSEPSVGEDLATSAAVKVIRGYERAYDPARGTLRAYIAVAVTHAVDEEFKRWATKRQRDREIEDELGAEIRTHVRLHVGSLDQDPTYADGLFAVERRDKPYRELLPLAIAQLSESHQKAIQSILDDESAADNREQQVRKRAMANLRRIFEGLNRAAAL